MGKHGTYLAEDAQKNDQYVKMDEKYGEPKCMKDMHRVMFSNTHRHPGQLFYIVVCRVTLGYPFFTQDANHCMARPGDPNGGQSLWHPRAQVAGSQLNNIHGTDVSAHSLVGETGKLIARNREFVIYNKA